MAGSWDRNWQRSRGTRSQFKLENLQPFKYTYPVYLTDIMEAGLSTQANATIPAGIVPNAEELFAKAGVQKGGTSPYKETRTRAVREYEQTIEQYRKENFDLKLKIYLFEEEHRKRYHNKNPCSEEADCNVNVIINLKVETEHLKRELKEKEEELQSVLEKLENFPGYKEENEALQNALEQANNLVSELHQKDQDLKNTKNKVEELSTELSKKEQALQKSEELVAKYSLELKELENKQEELQAVLKQYPTTEEILEIKEQYSLLINNTEVLNNTLAQRDREIEEINDQLKNLEAEKEKLESKHFKTVRALEACTKLYNEDIKMPSRIRPIVKDAVTAALSSNKNEVLVAVKNFKSALYELMPQLSDKSIPDSQSSESLEESQAKGSSTEQKSKRSQEKVNVISSVNSNHVRYRVQHRNKLF